MARTAAQALDIRLSSLPFVKRLEMIEELRDVLFSHELDALCEGSCVPEQKAIPVCPDCGSMESVRTGRRRDVQRYRCKGCGKNYQEERRRNAIQSSHLPKSKWMKYIACHVDGLTYAAAAERCGVSVKTAHYMGMRVMSMIAESERPWLLEAGMTAQVDETYVPESFKGNRSKCAGFEMPREPYVRGRRGMNAGDRAPGRSKADWLCVVTGVDEFRRCFFEISGRGSMDARECAAALAGRLERGSRVVTDDLRSYASVLRDMGVRHSRHVSTERGSLNRVNNLHSLVKKLTKDREAVSTRRLPLYLADFAWRWRHSVGKSADEARRELARGLASFDATGIAARLRAAAYPHIEWWGTAGGEREALRRELAEVQRGIDRARKEAGSDAALLQVVDERQAALDARAKEAGIRLRGKARKPKGRKAKGNMTLLMLRGGQPCTS